MRSALAPSLSLTQDICIWSLPRSFFSTLFPLSDAVVVFLAGSVVFTTWTLLVIGRWSDRTIAVLAPALAFGLSEVAWTPTNLQWIIAMGLAVIAVGRAPKSWFGIAFDCAFLVFGCLSGPFSIMVAPLFAWRWKMAWGKRDSGAIVLYTVAIAMAALQALAMVSVANHSAEPVPISTIVGNVGDLILWAGGPYLGLLALAAAVFGAVDGNWHWQRAGFLLIGSMMILAASVKFSENPGIFHPGIVGQRYWYTPSVLLFTALATMLSEKRPVLRWAGVAGIAAFLLGYTARPFFIPPRQHYGSWARAVKARAPRYKFRPGRTIKLPLGSR